MRSAAPTVVALALCACGGDDASPLFPADYLASYVQVRDCRPSTDHDLTKIVVLADPLAADAYRMRDRPFPPGAVLVKEERDFADTSCSGPVERWTVMAATESSPSTLDWQWQKVDRDRNVLSTDEPRCYACHANCGVAPDGYLGTCTVP
jgi:hypothetical protein